MRLRLLGKGGSTNNGCPSLYATDQDSYLVQGWSTDKPHTVEIPHLLTGFAEPDTFIGAALVDSGRGTFTLSGQPVTDSATVSRLELADDESAILVPRKERTFYGAADSR